jgi:hypothetical protein
LTTICLAESCLTHWTGFYGLVSNHCVARWKSGIEKVWFLNLERCQWMRFLCLIDSRPRCSMFNTRKSAWKTKESIVSSTAQFLLDTRHWLLLFFRYGGGEGFPKCSCATQRAAQGLSTSLIRHLWSYLTKLCYSIPFVWAGPYRIWQWINLQNAMVHYFLIFLTA